MVVSERVIETDVGTYRVPRSVDEANRETRLRKDGQPDRRTKAGKRLAAYVSASLRGSLAAYHNGRPYHLPEWE